MIVCGCNRRLRRGPGMGDWSSLLCTPRTRNFHLCTSSLQLYPGWRPLEFALQGIHAVSQTQVLRSWVMKQASFPAYHRSSNVANAVWPWKH